MQSGFTVYYYSLIWKNNTAGRQKREIISQNKRAVQFDSDRLAEGPFIHSQERCDVTLTVLNN